jgi:N-acetylglucosamine kinase-like BadF-type ATPase
MSEAASSGHYLGIDGGATKTQAAIVDAQGVLHGVGLGGSSNYDNVGVAAAQANIGQAVAAARRQARLDHAPFAATFLGLAGIVSPEDRAVVREMAEALELAPGDRIGVDHDCRIALAGGLTGRPGIALIAGTGSSCFGMNEAGDAWRGSGWGHLISDEGSGYWFGIQAMRAAVQAYDGRGIPTVLRERLQATLGLAEMDDLVRRLYVDGMSQQEIAALAPLVFEAARDGDERALALVREGMEALADSVLAVARKLRMESECDLALIGGIFQAGPMFVEELERAVRSRLPGCRVIFAEMPPSLGACLLALELGGAEASESVRSALLASAQGMEAR